MRNKLICTHFDFVHISSHLLPLHRMLNDVGVGYKEPRNDQVKMWHHPYESLTIDLNYIVWCWLPSWGPRCNCAQWSKKFGKMFQIIGTDAFLGHLLNLVFKYFILSVYRFYSFSPNRVVCIQAHITMILYFLLCITLVCCTAILWQLTSLHICFKFYVVYRWLTKGFHYLYWSLTYYSLYFVSTSFPFLHDSFTDLWTGSVIFIYMLYHFQANRVSLLNCKGTLLRAF